jgi:hypothetical protein
MRNKLPLFLLSIIVWLFSNQSFAATTPTASHPVPGFALLDKFASMNLKQAQQALGRKFTLKEKMGFLVLKQQVKRAHKKGFEKTLLYRSVQKRKAREGTPGSKGQTALVFGIAALGLLVIGLFVPYVIIVSPIAAIIAIISGSVARKQDPKDNNAMIGKLLGWISLGLFAILIIAVAIALSNGFW